VLKSVAKCLAHDGTFERCVPFVLQRHSLLSRVLNLLKNLVCIMCLMIDSTIVISKLRGVCHTQSCDPPRGLEVI
jgi:hypothetical protein